jgi:hypothetical protein
MKPTVGRMVHYYGPRATQPRAAIISTVWSDTCVNLAIFEHTGQVMATPPTSVLLVQDGNEIPSGGNYCIWPPRISD